MNQFLYPQVLRLFAGIICFGCNIAIAEKAPTAAEILRIKWVNVPAETPEGVQHGTFHSECMDTTAGYNIYLPPGYDTGNDQRFPVIYFLHGVSGNESRSIGLAAWLHSAILKNEVPPTIMVFANGGRGSMYIDAIDGTVMSETMIIKELIPHIDARYRTIADRSGRAIQGFSMGGGGALRLAAKYPELFSSVVVYGAGGVREFDHIPSPEEFSDVEKARKRMPARLAMFGDDVAYWYETSSWHLLEKNRDRIVDHLPIRIVIGTEDYSLDGAKTAQARLTDLKIGYEFELIQGPDHNIYKLYDHSGVKSLLFHARYFRD